MQTLGPQYPFIHKVISAFKKQQKTCCANGVQPYILQDKQKKHNYIDYYFFASFRFIVFFFLWLALLICICNLLAIIIQVIDHAFRINAFLCSILEIFIR